MTPRTLTYKHPPVTLPSTSRRRFIGYASMSLGGLALSNASLLAQGTSTTAPLNRFPRMVQEYFVRRIRKFDQRRSDRIYSLATQKEAVHYVQSVRQKIRQSFGPEPSRTPLNPKITRVIERDGYRIENLIFESRPGFLVTANLYIPNEGGDVQYPVPGVIGTCGHSSNGKAAEPYQAFAQGLARQGYVVLLYDPIGQGERLQYPNDALKSRVGVGVREHLYAGNQQFLVGEFIGSWRAWDGIRALDYLLTRPEVDPKHLGVTGNSGGGTMTTWLAGLDHRYTMAAPSCFVTSFRRNLENELPADTEQCPPRAIELGLDHEDFLVALAPKPVIILAKERDYFDVRGSEAALARLKHLYRLLGAEDQVALFTGPTGHGYSQENREAMYAWFHRATGKDIRHQEPKITIEKDETLYCTPRGQVAPLGSRSVFEFTQDIAEAFQKSRKKVTPKKIKSSLTRLLKLRQSSTPPRFRILRPRRQRGFPAPSFTTYVIESEPGIQVITYLLGTRTHHSRPPRGGLTATLYVSNLSADQELRSEALLKQRFAEEPNAFYACDLRGTGESQPDTCGEDSFLQPYGSDYFYAIHSIMLGDPYPGQRTRDLLQVINWLGHQGHQSIRIIAKGRGTVPALLAAFVAEAVNDLTLINPLHSYQEIAQNESYHWPLSSFIPQILQHWDLPDIQRLLPPRCQVQTVTQ